jgi:endogenous inhibitor of DNA gyrase (YacG/DUF329 family)
MIQIKCPECQTPLRVRDEYAGKRMKCPKCQGPVPVPAAEPVPEVVEAAPAEEAPRPRRKSKYQPCPECGAYGAERVKYTLWGSFYGPSLCTHVRCPECGYAYNGRTGESNLPWIIAGSIVQAICGVGILAVIGAVAWLVMDRLSK